VIEYTIYFLSDGGLNAGNVQICDRVPSNTTFVPTAFTSSSGLGLALSSSSSPTTPTAYLTNAVDSDQGQFLAINAVLPASCSSGSNTNGAVVVNVANSSTTLPNATGPGTPYNSYGFVRFWAKVN
jgi:uncharacterized repeat protein (TIGR01451 family)